MNLSPESVKKTLLNKVNELSASSWQYTKKPTDFTRNRKISFSDVLLSTISMQKSASKTELLKYFDFNASAPTASALIQQRKKMSPEAFDSLFYSFSNAFFLDKTLKGYDLIAVDGSDIYIPRNPKDHDTYRVTDRYNKGFNMIHLNAAYNLLSHLYTDVILQPLNHINEYIAMCDIIDHYTATIAARHYKLPYNLKVVVHPEVESDYQKQYNNKSLYIPENAFFRPDINNLRYHQTHIFGLFKIAGSLAKAAGYYGNATATLDMVAEGKTQYRTNSNN